MEYWKIFLKFNYSIYIHVTACNWDIKEIYSYILPLAHESLNYDVFGASQLGCTGDPNI